MLEDELELSVLDLAEAIKEFGAQELWKQLKAGFLLNITNSCSTA